jgi:transcriptional regulator with XRE-family HTH domain
MSRKDRSPDPIDIEVGRRLRAFRIARGLSQPALAEAAGVTFQQVQKYERGFNRISASMMHRLAARLEIKPADFFPSETSGATLQDLTIDALQSPQIAEAVQLMSQMSSSAQSRALQFVRVFAKGAGDDVDC